MNGRRVVENVPELGRWRNFSDMSLHTHARMPREQSKPRASRGCVASGNLLSGRGVDLLELLEDVDLELGGLAVLVHVLDDLQRQHLVPERGK